jgi:hypothetical protein
MNLKEVTPQAEYSWLFIGLPHFLDGLQPHF